jgi:hypothetical protein
MANPKENGDSTVGIVHSVRAALLNEDQVAELLGWSPRTLQRRRWARLPPDYIKVGRSVRYDRQAVERFLADGEHRHEAT